jgi:hypothetical protein
VYNICTAFLSVKEIKWTRKQKQQQNKTIKHGNREHTQNGLPGLNTPIVSTQLAVSRLNSPIKRQNVELDF